jgi:DNA repair protein RecN
MLKSLFIQNFVLIDNLDIEFSNGFSVISGETGAGKSIILGALGLVLGQRADVKSIKQGADKCVIEATFDISKYDLADFFEANDMEFEQDVCLFRRELYASGKSRAFVNDSPASLAVIKELGNKLIDIHSQHQNLLLGDAAYQLRIVDLLADNRSVQSQYREAYNNYRNARKQLRELTETASQSREEEDYMRFQLQQLDEANFSEGEQESLEQEQEMLNHAEEIKMTLGQVSELLSGDELGVTQKLKDAIVKSASLVRYYPDAKEMEERLRTAYIDLTDLASETSSRLEDVEYNPERLDWVNHRLDLLYSLQQKHHAANLGELLELKQNYHDKLQTIDSFDEQIAELNAKLSETHNAAVALAGKLSALRKSAAKKLEGSLTEMITTLGIPHARISIDFTEKKEPETYGMDNIAFFFSANKNNPLRPIAETASGGEISRLMLCLKALVAGSAALPSIIFDEVDTGVSGDIAAKMGEIMSALGKEMQVMAITHLPQIAAKGGSHYLVYKQDSATHTATYLRRLTDAERVNEVARMLSGHELTDAAIANARDLLKL